MEGTLFIIRPVERRDREALIKNYYSYQKEIKRDVHFGLSSQPKIPTLKEERKWFAGLMKDIKRGDAIASIAERNGHVVGMCDVHRYKRMAETLHIAELGIAIRKDSRGIGIGEMLLRDIIERSKHKFEMLRLSVFATNDAKKLYKKVGFVEFGVLPNGLKRRRTYIDNVFMYLNLKERLGP
ncbi:MAG: GNAT family N-acetyltransferase [Candidatus Micrarchaeales archaeon]